MAKKNAVSAKTANLLRRIVRHILEEPKRFVMDTVRTCGNPKDKSDRVYDGGIDFRYPPCGTAACIAGWACLLGTKHVDPRVSMGFAEEILGIDGHEGTILFLVDRWPEQFSDKWDEARTPRKRAQIAARRIEHFIKTGE